MTPHHINGATHIFQQPADWDADKHGRCGDLAVLVADGCSLSAWKPSAAERRIIAEGGVIVLQVVGGQPPVCLWAQDGVSTPVPVVPDRTILAREVLRLTALLEPFRNAARRIRHFGSPDAAQKVVAVTPSGGLQWELHAKGGTGPDDQTPDELLSVQHLLNTLETP